jgi:hypothetical protein
MVAHSRKVTKTSSRAKKTTKTSKGKKESIWKRWLHGSK